MPLTPDIVWSITATALVVYDPGLALFMEAWIDQRMY